MPYFFLSLDLSFLRVSWRAPGSFDAPPGTPGFPTPPPGGTAPRLYPVAALSWLLWRAADDAILAACSARDLAEGIGICAERKEKSERRKYIIKSVHALAT